MRKRPCNSRHVFHLSVALLIWVAFTLFVLYANEYVMKNLGFKPRFLCLTSDSEKFKEIPVVNDMSFAEVTDSDSMQAAVDEAYIYMTTSLRSKFSDLCDKHGIRVFVVDPPVLRRKHFDDSEKALLYKERCKELSYYSNNTNTIIFGVFRNDSEKLKKSKALLTELRDALINLKHVITALTPFEKAISTDGRLVFEVKCDVDSHSCITIHVIVFHERNDFYWTSEIALLKPSSHAIEHTHYIQTFDKFKVKKAKEGYWIPDEPPLFLCEIPRSRFIPCKTKDVEIFRKNYSKATHASARFSKWANWPTGMALLKQFGNERLTPIWISSGTLLGWLRQCDHIPYTSDVDLTGVAAFADDVLLHKINHTKDMKLIAVYGSKGDSYQFALNYKKLKFDIFFGYEDKDNFWFGAHNVERKYRFKSIYPKFELCTTELSKVRVLLPCTPEAIVRAEYGPQWQRPKRKWNYETDPFNIGEKRNWTEQETETWMSSIRWSLKKPANRSNIRQKTRKKAKDKTSSGNKFQFKKKSSGISS